MTERRAKETGGAVDPRTAATLARLTALKADPALKDHPLLRELETLAAAHVRLVRRMDKLTRISDGFQGQLKELNDSLQRVSRTDPLTELPNRRAMMEELRSEMARSVREGTPMVVIMADVDRFKRINDTYGHEAGDTVLQGLGQGLQRALRAYDVCARWGGEEFLVLLPGTDAADAMGVAEKLRKAAASVMVPVGEEKVSVTLSLGVAALAAGDTLNALLRRADERMYEAKRRGGDHVI